MKKTHIAFVTIASVFLVSTLAGAVSAQPQNRGKLRAGHAAQERFQHHAPSGAAVAGTPMPGERLDRWEDRWDHREDVRDRREDRRDRRENIRDRREDRREDRRDGPLGPGPMPAPSGTPEIMQ